jgi:hypothetical protein
MRPGPAGGALCHGPEPRAADAGLRAQAHAPAAPAAPEGAAGPLKTPGQTHCVYTSGPIRTQPMPTPRGQS